MGLNTSAQTTTSSGLNTSDPLTGRQNDPYSKFGIGTLQDGNNVVLRGMGDVTSAYENPYAVNSDNPASYSFLLATTYEAGFTASSLNINSGGQNYATGTATISYLNLGIPLSKNAGLCFGFRPYSHTYYELADTLNNSAIGQAVRSYNGTGGLNFAYVGAAYRYKGLSLGINAGYLFGTITNITAVDPIDTLPQNRAYTTEYANYNRIGGIIWKAGLMYQKKIDSDYTITIGGTLSLQQNVSQRLNSFQISGYNFGDTIVNDTINYSGEQTARLKLPMSYSIGVMLTKNDKWDLGADFSATKWSGFYSSLDSTMNISIANQSYRFSLGGDYMPDVNNTRNYFSRVTYRFGLYYGTDYLNINNTQIMQYGLTAGASLPFRRSLSKFHVALDVGRVGTTSNNLSQETFVKFSLGFSFCDKWFIPRKYD